MLYLCMCVCLYRIDYMWPRHSCLVRECPAIFVVVCRIFNNNSLKFIRNETKWLKIYRLHRNEYYLKPPPTTITKIIIFVIKSLPEWVNEKHNSGSRWICVRSAELAVWERNIQEIQTVWHEKSKHFFVIVYMNDIRRQNTHT